MPLWIQWLQNHWFPFLICVGVVVAILFVIAKRKLLFYKE